MEAAYFRSPSRRELKERRQQRKDVARSVSAALTELDTVVNAIQRGDTTADAVDTQHPLPVSDIPSHLLPKRAPTKAANAQSLVKPLMRNSAYEADLKTRQPHGETLPAANGGSKRPIVTQERALPLSWEAQTGRKNDLSKVTSKLTYVHGHVAPPPIYTPEEGNPRKVVAEKRRQRTERFVKASENKPKAFEFKLKNTKMPSDQIPRVASIAVDTPAPRPKSAPIQGKAFR